MYLGRTPEIDRYMGEMILLRDAGLYVIKSMFTTFPHISFHLYPEIRVIEPYLQLYLRRNAKKIFILIREFPSEEQIFVLSAVRLLNCSYIPSWFSRKFRVIKTQVEPKFGQRTLCAGPSYKSSKM